MVNVKDLLVLNIVLVLVTCSFAEEPAQNSIQQKRNVEGENLPLYQANLRHTEVKYDHVDHGSSGYEQHQQHQSDWEMQKARAQGLTFHGSSQHHYQQQPWVPQPDYIQHNHISQQVKNQQHLPKHYLQQQYQQQVPQQQVQQYKQPQPQQLFKPVNQYQKPQEHPMAAHHRLVYPVSILMRPPTVTKKVPVYMDMRHIMYHVPKPVSPVAADKPLTWMFMDQSSGKPIPMQVIIRDVDHGKKPFWGWS